MIGVRPRVALSVTSNLGAVLEAIKGCLLRGRCAITRSYSWREISSQFRVALSVTSNQMFLVSGMDELNLCNSPRAHHAGHCSLHLGRSFVEGKGAANL